LSHISLSGNYDFIRDSEDPVFVQNVMQQPRVDWDVSDEELDSKKELDTDSHTMLHQDAPFEDERSSNNSAIT
jgi:hypothetical protein